MNKLFFVAVAMSLSTLSAQAGASPARSQQADAPAPAVAPAKPAGGAWGAQIDYDHSIERPDQLASVSRNGEIGRPAFATLQRSFGSGGFRPYFGVGVGQASARFDTVQRGEQDSLAVKGVVGSKMTFTDEIGGFVQYDYAVASENPVLAEDDASHGIRFGLSIRLN